MKSIFDKTVREELAGRINLLSESSQARWGKMTVGQMLRHCCLCETYYLGNVKIKRSLLGRLVGRHAIQAILKDEAAVLRKNAPSPAIFQVHQPVEDINAEKQQWIYLLERYTQFNQTVFTHWFFGRMQKEELGQFIYKHADHHLRQFSV